MKKSIKRVIAHVMIMLLSFNGVIASVYAEEDVELQNIQIGVKSSAWDGVSTERVFENGDYRITFTLSSYWDTGYSATIKIDNLSESEIQNWRLGFTFDYEITDIWNAEILSIVENDYVIKNVGWNQDIASGGSVEFGLTSNQAFQGFPESYELIQNSVAAQEDDYEVAYHVDGDWGTGFYGSITITNNSTVNQEEWVLEFDYDREITEIWNGVIESHEGRHYIIRNAEYNSVLEAGECISIGIKGCSGTVADEPSNYMFYAHGEPADNDVSDGDISGSDISGGGR